MKKIIQLFLFTFLIFPLPSAELSTGEGLFRKALAGEADYSAAASEFAHMIDRKTADSGALYYNLGNALYLDGDHIAALTAYSAALNYRPGNSDYIANRDLILTEMELPLPVPSGTEYIFHAPVMLLGSAGSLLLLTIMLMTALLTAALHLGTRSEIYRTGSFIILFLAFTLSISIFSWKYGKADPAVVKNENTVLRQGDSPLYDGVSDLPPGTEVRIIEEREGWYRIKTMRTQNTQSTEGWLRSRDLMKISELIDNLK